MRRRSKAIAATATITIAAIAVAIVLLATLQAALTTESVRNEQNPAYVEVQHSVQAGLNESVKAGNLTLRVTKVMNGTDRQARLLWATHETALYAPLNPVQDSKYVIINATVANAMNGTSRFRYADIVLVGSDGRSYYANYAVGNASCTTSLATEQLKAGAACDIYIAYSIPSDVAPVKLVYEALRPLIIVDLA